MPKFKLHASGNETVCRIPYNLRENVWRWQKPNISLSGGTNDDKGQQKYFFSGFSSNAIGSNLTKKLKKNVKKCWTLTTALKNCAYTKMLSVQCFSQIRVRAGTVHSTSIRRINYNTRNPGLRTQMRFFVSTRGRQYQIKRVPMYCLHQNASPYPIRTCVQTDATTSNSMYSFHHKQHNNIDMLHIEDYKQAKAKAFAAVRGTGSKHIL